MYIISRNNFKIYLLCFFVGILGVGKAQYPVHIIPQLVSPYTLNLSEYYTGITPKMFITLTNRDMQRPVANVRLKMSITGQLASVFTSDFGIYPSITLNAGVPLRLSMNDLEPYFNPANLDFTGSLSKAQYIQQNKLPEGFYTFCFQVVEVNTNKVVSENTCTTVWISLSDPPLLNTPYNGASVAKTEPTNLLFNWTPRHLNSPNGAFNTEYIFELKEIWDNAVDPQAAFQTAQIFYTVTTQATSVLYGPSQPILIPGKKYAWRVRAKAQNLADDKDDFKNNGYSDVFSFVYKENCAAPLNTNATIQVNKSVDFTWVNANGFPNEYSVEYRKKSTLGTGWFATRVSNASLLKVSNMEQGATYEYRVGRVCNASTTIYSYVKQVVLPAPPPPPTNASIKGNVLWAYYNNGEAVVSKSLPLVANETYENKTFTTSTTLTQKDTNTVKKNRFANVTIRLYQANGTLVATTTSASDGTYKINFDSVVFKPNYTNPTPTSLYLILSKPNSPFNDVKVNIPRNLITKMPLLNNVLRTVMYVKSFEFQPKVIATDYNLAKNGNMSLDVFVDENNFNKVYSSFAPLIGIDTTKTFIYNGVKQYIVATLTDGTMYKKLLQTPHNIRFNCVGNPFYFFNNNVGNNSVADSFKTMNYVFYYVFKTKFDGVITCKGKPRSQVTVTITTKSTDYSNAATATTTVFTTKTNEQGYYSFENIPRLKTGAAIAISVSDKTVRKDVVTDSIKTNSSTWVYTKNLDIESKVYTYVGRLVDQNNLPVANALIDVDGVVQNNKTNSQGFFMFKYGFDDGSKEVIFTANGYTTGKTKLANYLTKNLAVSNDDASNWELMVKQNNPFTTYKKENSGFDVNTINADFFGIGTGSLASNYTSYINEKTEKLEGIKYAISLRLSNLKDIVKLKIYFNGQQVKANINITKEATNTTNEKVFDPLMSEANKDFLFAGTGGRYTFSITPVDGEPIFAEFFGEFTLNERNSKTKTATIFTTDNTIIINLADGVKLTGIVKSKDSTVLDSTSITTDGLPYKATTNAQGSYTMYMPKNVNVKYHIARRGYNSIDESLTLTNTLSQANFTLEPVDKSFLQITTISGFAVALDKQVDGGAANTYVVSGKLTLANNDVFTTVADNTTLTFRNVSVNVDAATGNALPIVDIIFEEAVLQTKAFGYAVEVEGLPQIQLKKLRSAAAGDYSTSIIGGGQLITKLSTSGCKIKLADAILRDDDVVQNNNAFNYVYVTPTAKINALSKNKSYKVEFMEEKFDYKKDFFTKKDSSKSQPDSNYVQAAIIPKVSLFIHKYTTQLAQDGLSLNGYFQVPKQIAKKIDSSGKILINKFTLDNNFNIAELTFAIGEQKPLYMQLQKITVKLTSVSLFGLGTPNAGVGFGGEVWLKKKDKNSTDKNDVLTIKKLELINKPEGVTFSGSFALPTNGITVKNLVFKTPANATIDMSYNFSEQDFTLEATGTLDYTGTSTNKVVKSVFPIGIQSFKLKTKNWGVFIKANPNIQLDYKVMKVNVTDFLVNIGYAMTLDQMNQFLVNKNVTTVSTGGPDDAFDDSDPKTSWAIGIGGSIEFPVKKLKVSAGASVLFGYINNAIDARINEINLEVDNKPAFSLKASVKMQFANDKQGFEAAAKLTTLNKEFAASFKYYNYTKDEYYNYTKDGIELGASINASVDVTTGPIRWLTLGGGFNFNTAQKTYEVFFSGDVTTAGTPKEAAFVRINRIGLLFDLQKCPAGNPVFDGNGELFIKNQSWGTMSAKFDFCSETMLITVNGKVPLMAGISSLQVSGVMYGLAPKNGHGGAFFLGINASLSGLLGSIAQGNAFIALGVNYNNNHPLSPQAVRNLWNSIDYAAKSNNGTVLNGIFVSAVVTVPSRSGSFNVRVVGFDLLSASYSVNASGTFRLYYNFTSKTLAATATVNANANASLTILGFDLNGSAYVNGNLVGGYDGSWYINGNLSMGFQVWHGSANCNSINWNPYSCACVDWNVPCCDWPCIDCSCKWNCTSRTCLTCYNLAFKVCFNANASFNYRQGSGTSLSVSF